MKIFQVISSISFLLITISQAQQVVWVRTHSAHIYGTYPDVATDSRNYAIVVAYPYLIKYDTNGEIIWEKEINFGIWKSSIAVDKGDSIIIGGGDNPGTDSIWYIMKFTPTGESLWGRSFVFALSNSFYPVFSDIGIDKQNNILVTGYTPGDNSNWLIFKLTPSGEIDWKRTFSSNWGPDRTTGICADESLNVIVGGERGIYGIPRSWYPQVYKYSPTGDSLWVVYYMGYHHNYKVGELTTDRFGNILLPGREMKSFLFKYDSQGNYLWQWFEDTTSFPYSEFHSCVTDSEGNIFTTGASLFPPDTVKVEIKKFKLDGDSLWTFFYFLGVNYITETFWFKIDMDKNGNIIVAANKDSFVHVLKVTEQPGILEEKFKEPIQNYIFPSIISTKNEFKINFPFNVTSIEIYNKTGRLVKKEVLNKKEYILNGKDKDIKKLPLGVYFIKIMRKENSELKNIILTR